MKKLFSFLIHPIVVALVGLALISLLIWFAGPYIKFGAENTAPLGSAIARLLAIMAVLVIWGLNNLRLQFKNKKNNNELVTELKKNKPKPSAEKGQAAEEINQLGERFGQALTTLKSLKFSGAGGKKALYELPWYIIVGPPGSGKTTALVNSGLEFPLAEQFGKGALQGVGGTRNCDWWFTNSAVLIDTAGRYTTQDSHRTVDSSAWEGFLDLLKRNRRRRPINGAIVAISLQDLLTQTEEERALNAKTIRKRLDELMEKLQIRFPVYLMFTKVDLVSGFREFFEDLGKDDRDQVWGVSLPNAPEMMQSPDFDYFNDEFDALIARLYDRVLWQVHQERNVQRRINIYDFPQQMENIKDIAKTFVQQTFAANRFQFQPYLRGVYFSSGTQDGTPIDRLMSSISANFGFSRESSQAPSQQGKSFFLTRLFQDVIFPESELVGTNVRYEKFMRWGQRALIATLLVVSGTLLAVWSGSVTRQKMYMSEVDQHVSTFAEESTKLNAWSKDIRTVLPALNALLQASEVYDREEHPWLVGMGLYDSRVNENAKEAYHVNLRTLFLPKLLNEMEAVLSLGHEGGDLYNTFRLYMMFNKVDKLDADLIKTWFKNVWNAKYPGEATRRQELTQHLDAYLNLDVITEKLNPLVVRKTRDLLLQVPPAQRIYARVKNNPIYTREVDLLNSFGESARMAFTIDEPTRDILSVPVLFTIDGYDSTDFTAESPVINDVTNERWVLADGKDDRLDFAKDDLNKMSGDVRELYLADYSSQWQKILQSLKISEFKNLRQANDVLVSFTDPVYSPLRAVLKVGSLNTELTPPIPGLDVVGEKAPGKAGKLAKLASLAAKKRETTSVDKRFNDIHLLMRESKSGQAPIDSWIKRIEKVQEFLAEVSLAPDPGEKAYKIAKDRYKNGAVNPIVQLKGYAKNAPKPLEGWLNSIADQTWRVIMSTANQHVGSQWRSQVYAPYSRALAGRYPLKNSATDELALFDFIEFFKPSGTVDTFFQEYIKPFVDVNNNWRNRAVDGYSIGFSSASIKQVRRAISIKNVFFRINPESPTIGLELKPFSMDANDARFTLDVGDTRLTYNHGPKFWKKVNWSGADEGKRIRVAIEDLSGELHEKTYSGPWAWFRLMDASNTQKTSRSNVFRITFSASNSSNNNAHSIVYEGKTQSINNPFSNNLLGSFRAPESL